MSGRRIAPRPAVQSGGANTTSPLSGDIDEPQSSLSQTQNTGNATATATAASTAGASMRKKVTSACQGCQKRRVKCDGNLPCATCTRTKNECTYTPDFDGRSIKRKFLEIHQDQEFLFDIIKTLKYGEDDSVSQVVSLIRSGATHDEIKACVVQQLIDIRLAGRDRSPEFKELQKNLDLLTSVPEDRTRPAQRSRLLEIQRLVHRPLYNLPAAPWTTVTNDDELVSNLISVWLTWDKGWLEWIDEDLFVRDMQSRAVDSPFCSPFLVNCLLAWSCPYSDFKDARTVNGTVSPLMLQFIDEAKRHLDEERLRELQVTTIQGLLFLHAALAAAGRDQSGYGYMLEAMGRVQDLRTSTSDPPHPDPLTAKEISSAIDRCCWGVFSVTTYTLSAILKPQTMKPPRRARPAVIPASQDPRRWRPYPYLDEYHPSCRDELFDLGCDIAILEAELSLLLYDVDHRPPRKQLEQKIFDLNASLNQMIERLPSELSPRDVRDRCCPSVYAHHARIQSVVLRMFSALREPSDKASPEVIELGKKRCIEAAVQVARVCKINVDVWGVGFLGLFFCQPVTIGLSILLEVTDTTQYSSHVTDLCVMLRAMSRRWPICMGMLRMLQLDARTKGLNFPPETDKLFEEFETSAWRQRELKRYFTLYPMAETSKAANLAGREVDMGKFLEAMEKLELDDSPAVSRSGHGVGHTET